MPVGTAVFLGLVVVYGAVGVLLGRFSVTMPIIFVAVGALFGPQGLFETKDVELLTEMTLALLLFADASTLNYRQVTDDVRLPGRLLLIGMPLIVALGGLVALGLFPEEGVGFALLLGAILAPTDAALGIPILSAYEWLAFVEARYESRIENIRWDSTSKQLDFDLVIPASLESRLGVLVPVQRGTAVVRQIEVDGQVVGEKPHSVGAVDYKMVEVGAGRHRVHATYS